MGFDSDRRHFLAAVAGVTGGFAGCAGAGGPRSDRDGRRDDGATAGQETTPGGDLPESVGLETLATGFELPLGVAFAPDADRRYVADQPGRVFVHGPDGLRDRPFLDLRDTVVVGKETGLLGLALHPDFAENRRVFVRYSAPPREDAPAGTNHTFVLSEFEANDDGTRIDPDSERALLEFPEPQPNHNAGSVVFGPYGYLFVGIGDGGGAGDKDGHADDWYDAVEGGNGQDVTENLLGSVLRIDVDNRENGKAYAIPDGNPFADGGPGLPEHYAWGFRNPWRMAFDRGRLFVADVGQNAFEEVNLVERGGNYGWNVREGTHCFKAESCPDSTPESVRGGEPLLDPVIEYPHYGDGVTGISVIGGNVYRGSALPGLAGAYVFADLAAEGQLLAATPVDEGLWPIGVVNVAGDDAAKLGQVYSFGRDADGELYVLGSGDEGAGLHRIVPAE
ncbi:PQQ-dependent sugar dehydrogenase [Halorussus sp. AFM4]|uniref:PQQ-dependent sugar dehydrogenase n=1 Tax=Halorussus sp. AFM4 TaxID=3421651 RepID=UPI003EBC68F4